MTGCPRPHHPYRPQHNAIPATCAGLDCGYCKRIEALDGSLYSEKEQQEGGKRIIQAAFWLRKPPCRIFASRPYSFNKNAAAELRAPVSQ